MCRNIKTLFNFEPPATEDEIRASALQFVRKLSGVGRPSQANQAVFDRAVEEVSEAARRLLISLHIQAPPRDRAVEAEKAKERSRLRFGCSVGADEAAECLRHSGAVRSTELRCAVAHLRISRFRVWSFGPSRNDEVTSPKPQARALPRLFRFDRAVARRGLRVQRGQ